MSWVNIWKVQMSRFSHDSLDFFLCRYLCPSLSLNVRRRHLRISERDGRVGGHSFGTRCSWRLIFSVYHSYISECDERWSSHRREAAGASILTRRLCRPPHPTEHARRRPGLARQGTCGCHLTGEKQVEMKGSSRFCQSTSGLLSITAPTSGGVCASVRACVSIKQQWVRVCARMCILSHWPTGSVCVCICSIINAGCVRPCVYISAFIPASECVRKHIDLEGVCMSVCDCLYQCSDLYKKLQ